MPWSIACISSEVGCGNGGGGITVSAGDTSVGAISSEGIWTGSIVDVVVVVVDDIDVDGNDGDVIGGNGCCDCCCCDCCSTWL